MNGHIIFESILPMPEKAPTIFTIGAFSIIDSKTKDSITFDFEGYTSVAEFNNNKIIIDTILENFDIDFLSGNTKEFCDQYISQERLDELIQCYYIDILDNILVLGELDEIFYECYAVEEQMFIPMKLVSFEIGSAEISKDKINRYNKNMLAKEYNNVLNELNTNFENYKNELEEGED